MDKFDRIYAIHGILKKNKYPVALTHIMDELECGRSTAKRLISKMRLYLDAPIDYDREQNGYYYNYRNNDKSTHPYELPGLWFNTSELHALLAAEPLLESVDPGIYSSQLSPLKQRTQALLEHTGETHDEINQHIRILAIAQRKFNDHIFRHITTAVLQRKKLSITYAGRQQNQPTERTVSPQRLIHHRYKTGTWIAGATFEMNSEASLLNELVMLVLKKTKLGNSAKKNLMIILPVLLVFFPAKLFILPCCTSLHNAHAG